MAEWKHKIDLKSLFECQPAGVTDDEFAKQVAPEAERRVRALMAKVERSDGQLYVELDEVADAFRASSSAADFNRALDLLYDAGDDGHRVWVQ